MIGKLRNSRTT